MTAQDDGREFGPDGIKEGDALNAREILWITGFILMILIVAYLVIHLCSVSPAR